MPWVTSRCCDRGRVGRSGQPGHTGPMSEPEQEKFTGAEIGKDAVQSTVEAAATTVGEVATIITAAVRDVATALGGLATEVFEIREASRKAAEEGADVPDPGGRGAARGLTPRQRSSRSRTSFLRRAEPVALGEQLGDLRPVRRVVEHHADDGGRPRRLVERRPGVGQSEELVAAGAERQHGRRLRDPGEVAVGRLVALLGDHHVRDGLAPDSPADAGPGVLLVDLGQGERDLAELGHHLGGRLEPVPSAARRESVSARRQQSPTYPKDIRNAAWRNDASWRASASQPSGPAGLMSQCARAGSALDEPCSVGGALFVAGVVDARAARCRP